MHYPRELGVLPKEESKSRKTCYLNAKTTQGYFGHRYMTMLTCIQVGGSQFKLIFSEAFCLVISSFPNPVLTSSDCLSSK